jgi:hypothetical protein
MKPCVDDGDWASLANPRVHPCDDDPDMHRSTDANSINADGELTRNSPSLIDSSSRKNFETSTVLGTKPYVLIILSRLCWTKNEPQTILPATPKTRQGVSGFSKGLRDS